MLSVRSIKSLYTLALAEGEGVGTAYEYFAKRLLLRPWLRQVGSVQRVLIAGLPQKYGLSLDLLLVAAELHAAVTVVDERPSRLAQLQTAVAQVQARGWLTDLPLNYVAVADLARLAAVHGRFDLALSSEVAQRVAPAQRPGYVQRVAALATAVALFAPNGDNPAHTAISGLAGLSLQEMQMLFGRVAAACGDVQTGYIDMPPFPPGITRSEAQRAQAGSGRLEALAMWGLGAYARLERFLPQGVRRNHSHIVYGFGRC